MSLKEALAAKGYDVQPFQPSTGDQCVAVYVRSILDVFGLGRDSLKFNLEISSMRAIAVDTGGYIIYWPFEAWDNPESKRYKLAGSGMKTYLVDAVTVDKKLNFIAHQVTEISLHLGIIKESK